LLFWTSPCPKKPLLRTHLAFLDFSLSEGDSASDSSCFFGLLLVRRNPCFGHTLLFWHPPCLKETLLRTHLAFLDFSLSEGDSASDSSCLFGILLVRRNPCFGLILLFWNSPCPKETLLRTHLLFWPPSCPKETPFLTDH